jgi:HD-like signal output (HDOD) protein
MTRVLFVDDEPSILEGLERMLFLVPGLECAFAASGEAALARLDAEPFDAVVTDMRMPGMDGAQLLARVLDRHPSVIRIVLSGHTELEVAMRVAPVAHQFLTKPCQPRLLQDVIERACGLRALLADPRLTSTVGRVKHLALQPRVYSDLTQRLNHPRVSVAEIARIIEQDVGLAAKVLQLVNSAFIGLPHRTSSLEAAVRYIGFNLLKSVIAYCEVFEVLVEDGIIDRPERLHALLTAAVAREIVRDPGQGDDAFAAGLFHDVGRLVLTMVLPDEMRRVADVERELGAPAHFEERKVFGAAASEVGAYLLALWGIPFPVVEAVAHHPEPWRVAARRFDLPGVVHVACLLARERTADAATPPAALPEATAGYLRELGLEPLLPEWRRIVQAMDPQAGREAA